MPEVKTSEIVIWGDGAGSTAGAVLDAIGHGLVNLTVTGVISANPTAGIFDRVNEANEKYGLNIPTTVVDGQPGRRQSPESELDVLQFLDRVGTQNLALLGCMTIAGAGLVRELNGEVPDFMLPRTDDGARELLVVGPTGLRDHVPEKLLHPDRDTERFGFVNAHPALTDLTANTHGVHASKRIIRIGADTTAWTLHAVAPGIDTGPKIAVIPIAVPPSPREMSPESTHLAAVRLNDAVQSIEKLHVASELTAHFLAHAAWRQQ